MCQCVFQGVTSSVTSAGSQQHPCCSLPCALPSLFIPPLTPSLPPLLTHALESCQGSLKTSKVVSLAPSSPLIFSFLNYIFYARSLFSLLSLQNTNFLSSPLLQKKNPFKARRFLGISKQLMAQIPEEMKQFLIKKQH